MPITLKIIRPEMAGFNLDSWFEFLNRLITGRLRRSVLSDENDFDLPELPAIIVEAPNQLGRFILTHQLSTEEVTVLLLAMAPHLQPSFFDSLIQKNLPGNGDYPQLGGVRGKNSRSFLPTGETVPFLLAGHDLERRASCQQIFDTDHLFGRLHLLWIEEMPPGEPRMSGKLIIHPEYLELFTTGQVKLPGLSLDFPAQHLTTAMDWEDLVLHEATLLQIGELEQWIRYHNQLMEDWGMKKKLKPGYRALFYGPPGTGKTLTATLLGKYTGREVFRVDLSLVVSKFIGETEKNLSLPFSRAENKNWILFFDEADALFSKRTNVRDAHDKYANQEAAYLLQRIESFDGLVILATNYRSNIDEAFIRRFHSVIHFPAPGAAERYLIWQKALPAAVCLAPEVDLLQVAKKYELTGSAIMSVVQHACLSALAHQTNGISLEMLLGGIRREYLKEGRTW